MSKTLKYFLSATFWKPLLVLVVVGGLIVGATELVASEDVNMVTTGLFGVFFGIVGTLAYKRG